MATSVGESSRAVNPQQMGVRPLEETYLDLFGVEAERLFRGDFPDAKEACLLVGQGRIIRRVQRGPGVVVQPLSGLPAGAFREDGTLREDLWPTRRYGPISEWTIPDQSNSTDANQSLEGPGCFHHQTCEGGKLEWKSKRARLECGRSFPYCFHEPSWRSYLAELAGTFSESEGTLQATAEETQGGTERDAMASGGGSYLPFTDA